MNLATKKKKAKAIQRALFLREHGSKLSQFTKYTKEGYEMEWFHELVCDWLDKLLDDVNHPDIQKLMIFIPPQHGKSELSSRRFPAYVMGKDPSRKIALCSYSPELASSFNRNIQQIMEEPPYLKLYPKTRLNSSRVSTDAKKGVLRNTTIFETVKFGGYVKTVGIGQALTGTTVDIGIIDDPFKDRASANSTKQRDHVWNWYQDVFLTRLHNKSKQLLLFTRWHEDDLAGRILDPKNIHHDPQEAKEWTVIAIPALKEEGKPIEQAIDIDDPRQIDEALWPQKHSAEKFFKQRKINPTGFNSLSQQRPTAQGGNKIKKEWFETINLSEIPFNPSSVTWDFWIDGAYTEKTENDPSAIMSAYYDQITGKLYIRNVVEVRKEMRELISYFQSFSISNGLQHTSTVWIEGKASGKSLKQLLSKPEFGSFNCREIDNQIVSLGKLNRVESSEPFLASGKVVLIQGGWNNAFIDQCTAFPNAKHDDMVDVLTYAIHDSFMGHEEALISYS